MKYVHNKQWEEKNLKQQQQKCPLLKKIDCETMVLDRNLWTAPTSLSQKIFSMFCRRSLCLDQKVSQACNWNIRIISVVEHFFNVENIYFK